MVEVQFKIKCPKCKHQALLDRQVRTGETWVIWNNCTCGFIEEYCKNTSKPENIERHIKALKKAVKELKSKFKD